MVTVSHIPKRATSEYHTPDDLYDRLNWKHHFELDCAATPENAKCENFYTEIDDGLQQPWCKSNFCNPPYGRQLTKWIIKACAEQQRGNTTVMLLPARVDVRWFHDYIYHNDLCDIEFLRGRLKFNHKNPAPFPCMLITFNGVTDV